MTARVAEKGTTVEHGATAAGQQRGDLGVVNAVLEDAAAVGAYKVLSVPVARQGTDAVLPRRDNAYQQKKSRYISTHSLKFV